MVILGSVLDVLELLRRRRVRLERNDEVCCGVLGGQLIAVSRGVCERV